MEFEKRVEAIKSSGWLYGWFKTVIIPLVIALVLMNQGIPIMVQLGLMNVFPMGEEMISLSSMLSYLLTLLLSIILAKFIGKLSFKDLGLGKKKIWKYIWLGGLYWFLAIAIVAIIINVLGGVHTQFIFKTEYISFIVLAFLLFIFQSTFEEFVYRSYLMPHLAKKFGNFLPVFITAILFVLLHIFNSGLTLLPIINLFLAGIVFGLVYFIWGSLWINGFAHALWNFSQGLIFWSLVSWNMIEKSIMKSMPVEGMDIISGGMFWFEGSIVTSIIGIIIIIILLIIAKKKNLDFTPRLNLKN